MRLQMLHSVLQTTYSDCLREPKQGEEIECYHEGLHTLG